LWAGYSENKQGMIIPERIVAYNFGYNVYEDEVEGYIDNNAMFLAELYTYCTSEVVNIDVSCNAKVSRLIRMLERAYNKIMILQQEFTNNLNRKR